MRLIIDAAHPFAEHLHSTIVEIAAKLSIPVIRFERKYPEIASHNVVWCDDYEEAVLKMEEDGIKCLLALTGVQTIPRLKNSGSIMILGFASLTAKSRRKKVRQSGFPQSKIVYYKDSDAGPLIDEISPDAVLTKESGDTGGFMEKVDAALSRNVKVFVVRRPKLSDNFIVVDGKHGLRRN